MLQLPSSLHHKLKVFIIINCSADISVIVQELFTSNDSILLLRVREDGIVMGAASGNTKAGARYLNIPICQEVTEYLVIRNLPPPHLRVPTGVVKFLPKVGCA